MSDAQAVMMALITIGGAIAARAVPVYVLAAAVLLVIAFRSPSSVWLACGLVASSLSAAAWTSLDQPLPEWIGGLATIDSDPQWINGALRTEVVFDGRHFLVWARGEQAKTLRPLLAGQRVQLAGPVRPLTGLGAPSQRRKHIAGQLNADVLVFSDSGSILARATNAVRLCLERGAASLPIENQALMMGIVLGDDREQSPGSKQDFEAAGLLHLTAVSGANVAFVLLVFAPLFSRMSLLGRLVGAVLLLGFFGALTRWEPSVVRAISMAIMVALGSYLGRPVSLWRALALGATAAVLLDPFLAGSIGFLLSISACAGMALLGPWLSRCLVGPAWFARAAGYAVSAQIGVAPVHLTVFGPMPLVGLPANILAGPMAAGIMVWGLVGGLAAGVAGNPLAQLIHIPTSLLTSLLGFVANRAANAGVGDWTPISASLLATLLIILAARHRFGVQRRSLVGGELP